MFWEGGFAAREVRAGCSLVIGRAQDCDVHVIHPSVSRRHVAVHAGPPLRVEDLGSANGTVMNGVALRANEATLLEPGKVVEAGGSGVSGTRAGTVVSIRCVRGSNVCAGRSGRRGANGSCATAHRAGGG